MALRLVTLLTAAAATFGHNAAQAAEPPCLTSGEFTALSTYSMPSVIRGAAASCARALPKDAFLRKDAEALASRYGSVQPAAWPAAKAAFIKVGGVMNPQAAAMFRTLPDDTLRPVIDGLIQGMVGQQLPADRCSAVDRLVMLLAPLPPQNTAELVTLAVGLGAKTGRAKVGQFTLCGAAKP